MPTLKPQAGPQERFLACSADVVIFGGGAGGGKSWSLLIEPLRHSEVSGFSALTFRRKAVHVRSPGGLWDASRKIYSLLSGKNKPDPREQQLDWKFPSGAIVKFAHLMNDASVYEYQGSEIALLCFDELCHFSFLQFTYLLSRNRSTCGVKPYVRATCNPDKDSWVRNFIDWWVGEDGKIIPERDGVIRYFHIDDQDIHWADDPKDLMQFYSQKEIDAGAFPRSFTFIRADIYDNPILLEKDPNYISSLKSQNRVDCERLLGGNWNISLGDLGQILYREYFFRYNLEEKLRIPGFFAESYFVVDGASTVKTSSDYSVVGLFAKGRFDNRWYIIAWVRVKLLEPDFEQLLFDIWNEYKFLSPREMRVEFASVGIGLCTRLSRRGVPIFEIHPDKDKFHRLNDGLGFIMNKMLGIPENAQWANKFFEECENFRGDLKHVIMQGETKPHDDQVDVLAYGVSTQITGQRSVRVHHHSDYDNKPKSRSLY